MDRVDSPVTARSFAAKPKIELTVFGASVETVRALEAIVIEWFTRDNSSGTWSALLNVDVAEKAVGWLKAHGVEAKT